MQGFVSFKLCAGSEHFACCFDQVFDGRMVWLGTSKRNTPGEANAAADSPMSGASKVN